MLLRAYPSPAATRPSPRGLPVEGHAPHRMGFPCSGRFPCHACRRQYPGGIGGALSLCSPPTEQRPSPSDRRVSSHITCFEACSAFTHVTACMLAGSPYATLCHRSVSAKFVASSHRSDCFRLERPFAGWDSHPLESAVFARHTVTSRLINLNLTKAFIHRWPQMAADACRTKQSGLLFVLPTDLGKRHQQ